MKLVKLIMAFFCIVNVASAQQGTLSLLKANVLTENGQYEKAIEIYQTQLSNFKTNPYFFKQFGNCYYKYRNFENAIHLYLVADSLRKNYDCLNLARCYGMMHQEQKCMFWLQKYLSLSDKINELEIISDTAFSSMLSSENWKNLWMKNWFSEQEIVKNTVIALIKRNQNAKALDELEKFEKKYVPRHEFYELQAKILSEMEQINPALYAIEKALAMHAHNDEYFMIHASLYFKLKKYKDAVNDISAAIKINPYNTDYYYLQVKSAIPAGELALATNDMEILKKLYPDEPETLHQLALLEKARGKYQNAMEYYDLLMDRIKNNPDFYLERGELAMITQSYYAADEDFGMALDLDPKLTRGYLLKGKVQILLDNKTDACNNFRLAKQLGNAEASQLLYKNCGSD